MPDRNAFEKLLAEMGRTDRPGGESAWRKNRIWLKAAPGTNTYDRSGFSIRVGDEPGSPGCIDLRSRMPSFVCEFLTWKKDMLPIVDYGRD